LFTIYKQIGTPTLPTTISIKSNSSRKEKLVLNQFLHETMLAFDFNFNFNFDFDFDFDFNFNFNFDFDFDFDFNFNFDFDFDFDFDST
jgi:hypothetical protein